MARGLTRASVMAIKEETTEGTLVIPAAATDFIAIQPTPEITQNPESTPNEEIRNSIGKTKPIQGISRPGATFSHYLRASGSEGVSPNFGPLLKWLFGETTVQATQRLTTAASTTTLVKLASGGTDYARGKAFLLKDSTNNYSIRPVHSVSSNDLVPAFALSAAPATGIGLGKFVNFSPTNTGHKSGSIHMYQGNGHSWEALAGGKVTSFGFSATAGELVNADYQLVGTKTFFNPVVIGATDIKLDFLDNATTRVATISAKTYRTPHELASAIQDAMNSLGSANTFTFVYNDRGASAGKYTVTSNGTTLSLLWNTGVSSANTVGDKIGFSVAADDTGALTYTSDNEASWVAPYTPVYDNADPNVAKNNEVLIGDGLSSVGFCANDIKFSFENEAGEVLCIGAETGIDANFFNGRAVTVTIEGVMDQHDSEFFHKFVNNTELRFCYNFGVKSGGNWVPGKCCSVYIPNCVISNFNSNDTEGVNGVSLELEGIVDSSGNGEIYVNFL